MSTLDQLHHGFHQAWHSLAEGWHALRERAAHALTYFTPQRTKGELQTVDEQLLVNASRWGLLAAEVREEEDQIRVRLEAPGMEPDQFDIEVIDDVLVVRGEKHAEREQNSGRYYLLERAYGAFERAIRLPAAVDQGKAKANYRHGVLSITLPKTQRARARRIAVNTD